MDLHSLQQILTVTLNLAAAIMLGALGVLAWLKPRASHWVLDRRGPMVGVLLGAALLAMLANGGLLWVEAALMAELPIGDAGPAAWSMISATHYGQAWCASMVLLLLAAGFGVSGKQRWIGALAMCAYFYTRSMVSHAAAQGDFSIAIIVDALHVGAISLWVGAVWVGAWIGLTHEAPGDCRPFVQALSDTATLALLGIGATGLFSAWHHLGSIEHLRDSAYGTTLQLKLVLVAFAVCLGGANRFLVMPGMLTQPRRSDFQSFNTILRIESIVLLAVLVLAAMLSSTSPPP